LLSRGGCDRSGGIEVAPPQRIDKQAFRHDLSCVSRERAEPSDEEFANRWVHSNGAAP
jgi:hypothetical protein